jgi:hypothetical protein
MSIRPDLTPCIICKKQVEYLWDDPIKGELPTNLLYALDIKINGDYGSAHDADTYTAIICDDCMKALIQEKLVTFKGNWIFGEEDQSTTPLI